MSVEFETASADELFDVVGWVFDAADLRVEFEMLVDCEDVGGVELRADAEARACFGSVGC